MVAFDKKKSFFIHQWSVPVTGCCCEVIWQLRHDFCFSDHWHYGQLAVVERFEMELNVCIVCQDQKVAVVERWPLLEVQLYCSVYSLYFLKIQTWWLGGFQHEDPMNGNKKKCMQKRCDDFKSEELFKSTVSCLL